MLCLYTAAAVSGPSAPLPPLCCRHFPVPSPPCSATWEHVAQLLGRPYLEGSSEDTGDLTTRVSTFSCSAVLARRHSGRPPSEPMDPAVWCRCRFPIHILVVAIAVLIVLAARFDADIKGNFPDKVCFPLFVSLPSSTSQSEIWY
jgi:hypothetical protein